MSVSSSFIKNVLVLACLFLPSILSLRCFKCKCSIISYLSYQSRKKVTRMLFSVCVRYGEKEVDWEFSRCTALVMDHRYRVSFNGRKWQNGAQTNGTDLDSMEWRVMSLPQLYLFLINGNRYSVHFNGTNRAQTNSTGFVWFRRIGVESNITAPKNFLVISKGYK